jgi:hypothetical protein
MTGERVWIYCNAITNSINFYCNHILLTVVVPARGRMMEKAASGSWERYCAMGYMS